MANFKRRRPRLAANRGASSWRSNPAWWDRLFHTRRKRAANKHLVKKTLRNEVDPDNIAWPIAGHKPTIYYW